MKNPRHTFCMKFIRE